jgi:hypothetical protein
MQEKSDDASRQTRKRERQTRNRNSDPSGPSPSGASAQTGSTDESIGRPENWREGRYQRDGADVDQAVNQPSQSAPKPPPAEQQKPVTLRDYE